MPLAVKINVALREHNCQKIGSERVKHIVSKNRRDSQDIMSIQYTHNGFVKTSQLMTCEEPT